MEWPGYVRETMDKLAGIGCSSFLVGGCVRDILLGLTPHDYDLVTSASADQIKTCFERVLSIGERHGTLGVMVDGNLLEISVFRGDTSLVGGDALPALRKDLAERDFTINAMAMDERGKLFDPWGGEIDLKRGLIRATGDRGARLFSADSLRMLRAVRLSAARGLVIESGTWQDIRQLHGLLALSAPERIREELNRILLSERPAVGMRLLYQSELLGHIIPELVAAAGFDQRSPHHDRDVFEHSLCALENTAPRLPLRLAALLHDVAKPACFSLE